MPTSGTLQRTSLVYVRPSKPSLLVTRFARPLRHAYVGQHRKSSYLDLQCLVLPRDELVLRTWLFPIKGDVSLQCLVSVAS
jgi:hypothetical protein